MSEKIIDVSTSYYFVAYKTKVLAGFMYALLGWWDRRELNSRPSGYEPPALTN